MTTLKEAKKMGMIGSFFMLMGSLIMLHMTLSIPSPTIIPIAYLVGLSIFGIEMASIFVFLAVKRISNAVNDREIYYNVLVWIILQVLGIAIYFYAIHVFLSKLEMIIRSFFDIFAGPDTIKFNTILVALWPLIAGLIYGWAALIISAWFLKRCYERIAVRTGTEIFGAVGYWYYWGTRLAIVFVGLIFIVIALILQFMAFYFLPSSIQSQRTAAFAIGPEF